MAYITSEQYRDAIFSQDARHELKVIFNGVELEDADNYCENFTLKSRILSNSSKVFSLDNFVSDEAQLVLHNVDVEKIVGPVDIQIGTLVGDSYEYVPIGMFNIQDMPITDKNKTTIKLRDNSVKFDFNYNGQPLIESEGVVVDEETGAKGVTKLQILKDICSKAGVACNINEFLGSEEYIGSYDDSVSARTYISFLAEQAGAIPTINRFGELIFIYLNQLVEQEIPIDLVESYQNGEKFKIARVVYEDAIRKFEAPITEEEIIGDNLYLNTANPYISSQEQVNGIYEIVKDFEIDSFKTGKTIGNPAIDKYDLIKIQEDNTIDFKWDGDTTGRESMEIMTGFGYYKVSNEVLEFGSTVGGTMTVTNNSGEVTTLNVTMNEYSDETQTSYVIRGEDNFGGVMVVLETSESVPLSPGTYMFYQQNKHYYSSLTAGGIIIGKTLATYNLTYNGKITTTYETIIDQVKKQENVTKNSEETFKRFAKTNIDNINNQINMVVAEQSGQQEKLAQMEMNVNNIQNMFQITGGNNLIKDSMWLLGDDVWVKEEGGDYEGGYDSDLIGKTVAISKIRIQNGKIYTNQSNISNLVVGQQHSLSYKISNDENTTTTIRLIGNTVLYEKTYTEPIEFQEETVNFITNTSNLILEIESNTILSGYGYIYDLMLNKGEVTSWEPASGEIVGTVIKLSQMGLQIMCTGSKIATLLTSEGFMIKRYENGNMYEVITQFTNDGFISKKGQLEEVAVKTYDMKTINYQGYETLVFYKMDGGI